MWAATARLTPPRPNPQSVVTASISAPIASTPARTDAATSATDSTWTVRWLITPSAIFFLIVPRYGLNSETKSATLPSGASTVQTSPAIRSR